MKKLFIINFLLYISIIGIAGDFQNKSVLDSVPLNGFYKIILTPEIVSALKTDYSDLRLLDSKNKEVPYLLYNEEFQSLETFYSDYPILENSKSAKLKRTRLVLENPGKLVRTEIYLIMRNSDVSFEFELKGSDDKINWYIITKDYPQILNYGTNETNETRVLRFPPSNYSFFEITIKTNYNQYNQILRAAYIDQKLIKGAFTQLPTPKIIQSINGKISWVFLAFNKIYSINRLEWRIKGPSLYLRNCNLGYCIKGEHSHQPSNSFVLSANCPPIWEFSTLKTDTLIITINNDDNPPLSFVDVKAYQLNSYIIADLLQNETYTLYFGDSKLSAPVYDLKYFASSLPKNVAIINTGKIVKVQMKKPVEPKISIIFNRYILWIVILVVAIVLVFLTVKTIKEVK